MPSVFIEVELSDKAATNFWNALTGKDDDVLLAVEKTILARLFPEVVEPPGLMGENVPTDPELVNVRDAQTLKDNNGNN